jgi:hypothetical protein
MLPRGEGGADAGLMQVSAYWLRNWGSRISAALFVLAICSTAIACSSPPNKTAAEIFNEAAVVFKGVAISAELMNLPETEEIPKDVPYIQVRWRVDEVYKGSDFEKDSAVTQYFCGGVKIVVGQPYIFSFVTSDLGEGGKSVFAAYPDLKWILYDLGTRGAWETPEEYDSLTAEFQKMSR